MLPFIDKGEKTMSCKNICKLCNKLIISTAVTYTAPNLVVTIPAGSYLDNEKYCIVIAQTIPADAVVDAPVVIQIGDGTELYPLNTCDCRPVTARSLRTRTKYSTVVKTTPTTGVFRLLGKLCNIADGLTSIDGTTPT